jgi:hypothetical protein
MGGAAKTAAERKIFMSTISARAAGWEMTWTKISLRYARAVIELDIFIARHHTANRASEPPRFQGSHAAVPRGVADGSRERVDFCSTIV